MSLIKLLAIDLGASSGRMQAIYDRRTPSNYQRFIGLKRTGES